MGMFDDVNVEIECPYCGSKVNGFQSKSSYCTLELVDPTEVDNFYSNCNTCGRWLEYSNKPPENPRLSARQEPFNADEIKELGFKLVKQEKENEK